MKRGRKIRLLIVAVVLGYMLIATQVEKRHMEKAAAGDPQPATGESYVDTNQLMEDVKILSSDEYQGRKTGTEGNKKAQAYILSRFEQIKLSPVQNHYDQKFGFTHYSISGLLSSGRPFKQVYSDATNLFGTIAGKTKSNRFLVMSAHYDHLGIRNGEIYHGADDDASGVAAVLAAAKYFSENKPEHSILFLLFDAEELGLKGSEAFFKNPAVPTNEILFNINADMVSRNAQKEIYVCGTYYDHSLKTPVEQLAKDSGVQLLFGHDRPFYLAGRVENWTSAGDHSEFHDHGIPFLYFGVEDHEDYHEPTDTWDKIDPVFFSNVANLMIQSLRYFDQHL